MISFAQLKSKSGPNTQLTTPQPISSLGQFPVQRTDGFPARIQHQLNTTSHVQTQHHFSNALNQRQSVVTQAQFGEAIQKRGSQVSPVQRQEQDEEYPFQKKSIAKGNTVQAVPTQGPVVQRLILGANGDLDTQNDDQIDAVVAELRSMDYDSLLFIKDMLDPTDRRDSGYIKLINYELGKADVLRDVSQASIDYGGIFTAAAVFVDGQLLGQTEPTTHPDSTTTYYQYDNQTDEDFLDEEHNSRNDAEVGTLEEAYGLVAGVAGNFTGETQIRIVIAGTSGPCDGCKERLQRFRQDILDLLPNGGILSIDSSYLNSTSTKERNKVVTRYGFTNQQAQTSARGEQYFNYRYPLAVKGQ